jgi:hypothetical protein
MVGKAPAAPTPAGGFIFNNGSPKRHPPEQASQPDAEQNAGNHKDNRDRDGVFGWFIVFLLRVGHLRQSSSVSRFTAGDLWILELIQSGDRPERYGDSLAFRDDAPPSLDHSVAYSGSASPLGIRA